MALRFIVIKRFKIILIIFTAILIYCNAYAQVPIEDPNATIELPNKKLAKKGMRIEGPITSISAGGLLLASFDSNYNFQIDLNEFNNAKFSSSSEMCKDILNKIGVALLLLVSLT